MMLWMLACATEEAPAVYVDETLLTTEVEEYSAVKPEKAALGPGVHGVVKLLVEHRLSGVHDEDEVSGSYVTKGTATLVVKNGEWLVVTARHVVLPNASVDSLTLPTDDGEFDEVFFDEVTGLGSTIAIGALSVSPATLQLSPGADVAVMTVAPEDRAAVLGGLESIGSARLGRKSLQGGDTGQAWGFPVGTWPKVADASVSSVREGFFVLNQALEPGYSGGPVLVDGVLAGIVTRSDANAGQATALAWPALPLDGGVDLEVPGTGEFQGLPITLD